MAIGVRIESNNLSGKTTTVTFLPTSGGTINLGSKTIPFNFLTADPYGVYEIYVPDYNYTYELSVNASVFSGQSFSFVSRLTTNYDNGSVTLNYNDFTAEIIDLGVDYAGWYMNDLYPLTNSGYGYYFDNDNNSCWKWIVFTDVFGNIIDQYQAFTDCNFDRDNLGGKWLTLVDNYNGVFKYFNGENVYTYNFDSSNYSLNVETGWDGVMSNNNFVVSIRNFSANTRTNYIVNSGTLTQFGSPYDNSNFYDNLDTYFSGDFICRTFFDDNNGSVIYVEFYNGTTGELIDNVTFPNNTYFNYQLSFYGDNKLYIFFYSEINYKFVHFNGNTSIMKTLDHDRNNYPNYDFKSNTNFFPNNGGSESFVVQMYTQNGGNNLGRIVTYCDLIYMLSGDTDFNTYTFQDSGSPDKTISYNIQTANNSVYIPCDNGNGLVSTLCISPSGVTYVNSSVSGTPEVYTYTVGNNYVVLVFTNSDYTGCTLNYISENAVLLDSISGITFTGGSYQFRVDSVGDVFRFTNYGDTNVFINTTSTQFQDTYAMSDLDYGATPGNQFKSDFIKTGTIVVTNGTTKYSSIITSDAFITGNTLPQSYGSFDVRVGEDKFMYVYNDVDGFVNIELYDFDYNLLNSEVTTYTNWWRTDACGNGFYTIMEANSQYTIYLVSESNITSKTLTNDNNYYSFNDYINWD